MMIRIFRSLFLIGSVFMFAGCANTPTSLGKVPPRFPIVATYGSTPSYAAVDKFSFTQAEVLYPASSGHHRISIGDYLLAEVLEILRTSKVAGVALVRFEAPCEPSSVLLPRVLCSVNYQVELHTGSKRSLLSGSISKVDIGQMKAKSSELFFMPVTLGDDYFQNELTPLLNAIVADLRPKLTSELSR